MRALVMKNKVLRVDDVADPEPRKGQVLVRTLSCGICASDTHLLAHGERLAQWSRDFGGPFDMEMGRDLVMGHEFCGKVVDYGPGSRRPAATPFVFECVGVPGVLDETLREAPFAARIVVAGVCLEPDPIFGAAAHTKGLNVQFGAIPTPADFDEALRAIGNGEVDPSRWVTGAAALESSVDAFSNATEANRHVRLMVHPVDTGS